jgi:hypothetical protein
MGQLGKLTVTQSNVFCLLPQGWTQKTLKLRAKYMNKLGNKAQMFQNHSFFSGILASPGVAALGTHFYT